MKPIWRRRGAAGLFFVSLVMSPVSMFTFAKDKFPVTLSLSWLAITFTAADIWATTDVRAEQEGNKKD